MDPQLELVLERMENRILDGTRKIIVSENKEQDSRIKELFDVKIAKVASDVERLQVNDREHYKRLTNLETAVSNMQGEDAGEGAAEEKRMAKKALNWGAIVPSVVAILALLFSIYGNPLDIIARITEKKDVIEKAEEIHD